MGGYPYTWEVTFWPEEVNKGNHELFYLLRILGYALENENHQAFVKTFLDNFEKFLTNNEGFLEEIFSSRWIARFPKAAEVIFSSFSKSFISYLVTTPSTKLLTQL